MIFDLHSHTTLSDGSLEPRELISRAVEKGVDTLAITDHDTLDAYGEIPPLNGAIKLVAGIELSTQWENTGIHVLGLNVDLDSDAIQTAARRQSRARLEREPVPQDAGLADQLGHLAGDRRPFPRKETHRGPPHRA